MALSVSPMSKFGSSGVVYSGVFVIAFLFFSEWLQKLNFIVLPAGIRQLICFIYFFVAFILRSNKLVISKNYFALIILMFGFIVLNFYYADVLLYNYVLGILFTFNFVLIFLFSSNTFLSISTLNLYLKFLLILILVFITPPFVEGLIDGTSLRYHPGFFREAGALGTSMNCGVILSVCLFIITRNKTFLYIALFLTFGVFFTTLKKAIICNILIWLAYAYYFLSFKKLLNFLLFSSLFLIAATAFVGADILQDIYDNIDYFERVGEEHVRVSMYLTSIKIANNYFPFGCGLGSFGSIPSLIDGYSKIYYQYGISDIQPLGPEIVASGATHMLFDTYWPHILGELGYGGLIFFLLLWLFPLRRSLIVLKNIEFSNFNRASAFFVFSIVFLVTIEGFTLYTPEIPAFVFFESGIAGYLYCHLKTKCILQ